ncbi:MAG: histidine phosphotransferase family protein, partial [Alphaproteobacteria bacterium]
LAFFRRAYGTGGSLTWDEARDLTQRYLSGGRHQVTWQQGDEESGEGEAVLARLSMNLILCAVDALPTGGEIVLTAGAHPSIEAFGNLGDLATLLDAFGGGERDWAGLTPRDVQPHWCAMLATHAGGRIAVDDDTGVQIRLRFVGKLD